MSTPYNPMQVMMGSPGKTGVPYIGGQPAPAQTGGPVSLPMNGGGLGAAPQGPNVVGPESVRATGTGPFDSAYRQDLATYAGGLFNRPGGNLSFNPTGQNAFGAPTGGGNAPLLGMPNTLLQQALGGNPFTYQPPQPQNKSIVNNPSLTMQDWLNQFMNQGSNQRGGQNLYSS